MRPRVEARDVIDHVRRVGAEALLLELTDPAWVPPLDAELRRRWGGSASAGGRTGRVREIVPAARTILLDGIGAEADRLVADLSHWPLSLEDGRDESVQTIAVVFDGPDLPAVAEHWGVATEEVVRTVVQTELQVAFCGFAPGFAYLAGLPAHLAVPRHDVPRTRVPAGAFGLAGEYAGVYPRSSPGGWQLLGRAVDAVLWDAERNDPALLAPGTRVRIVAEDGARRRESA